MSKRLTELTKEKAMLAKKLAVANRVVKSIKHKQDELESTWKFHCKKCGLAFKTNEIGYKDWKVRRTKQEFQPIGEYDVRQLVEWQVVETQHLACCPKCGKDFGEKVYYSDCNDCTPRYLRWEKKPTFAKCYKRCISKKIHKISKQNLEYMKQTDYDQD